MLAATAMAVTRPTLSVRKTTDAAATTTGVAVTKSAELATDVRESEAIQRAKCAARHTPENAKIGKSARRIAENRRRAAAPATTPMTSAAMLIL